MTGRCILTEERIRQILEDLAAHKISKEEARDRIEQIKKAKERKIHVKVYGRGEHKHVDIKVPLKLAYKAVNWIKGDLEGMDVKKVLEDAVTDPFFTGEIVHVTTDDGNTVIVTVD
jgi:hypothetical protein